MRETTKGRENKTSLNFRAIDYFVALVKLKKAQHKNRPNFIHERKKTRIKWKREREKEVFIESE